jgi:hypothetical protein
MRKLLNIDKALAIQGWMTPVELAFLAKTASQHNKIIEVGSFQGRSTRALADNTDGVVYAVDPWAGIIRKDDGTVSFMSDSSIRERFYCNLAGHIESGKVQVCQYKFHEWPEIKNAESFGADFIFIDGDHRYENVLNDIDISLTFKPKILAGHDYDFNCWPGVKRAVDEKFPFVSVEGTIWWTSLR